MALLQVFKFVDGWGIVHVYHGSICWAGLCCGWKTAIGASKRRGKSCEIIGLVVSHCILESDRIWQRGTLQVDAENVLHDASVLADHLCHRRLGLVNQGDGPGCLLVEIAECGSDRIDRVQRRFDKAVDYVQHRLNCRHEAPLRLCLRWTDKRRDKDTRQGGGKHLSPCSCGHQPVRKSDTA